MGGLDHSVHINMATLMNGVVGMVGPMRNISRATPMNGMVGPMGVMKHGNSLEWDGWSNAVFKHGGYVVRAIEMV